MYLWTALPDTFDPAAAGVVLEVIRTGTVADRPAAMLAAFNVAGFAAYSLTTKGPAPVTVANASSPKPVDGAAELKKAVAAHAAAGNTPRAAISFGGVDWQAILKTILTDVLPIVLAAA